MSKLAQEVQKVVDELRAKRSRKLEPEPVPPKRGFGKRPLAKPGKRR